MSESIGHVAALDFGATSGRVIVGEVGADVLRMQQFARFDNRPVQVGGRVHWNVLALWQDALDGLTAASRATPGLLSVATDTWGVDYALLRGGRMLANPAHYRDTRTAAVMAAVDTRMSPEAQFSRAGVEPAGINTIYQLAADRADGLLAAADSALLLPDLFTYWLSGRRIAERTMASTTGLLDLRSGQWHPELFAAAGIPQGLFPDIVAPGTRLGTVTAELGDAIGMPGLEVVAAGAHDTASAVVAVPLPETGAAYISCGTWGLVGIERSSPVLTKAAHAARFTNEAGVDDRFLLMRNAMGLWMLSESQRQWEREGRAVILTELLQAAAAVEREMPIVDVDAAEFALPGDMPARITQWCAERGIRPPEGPAELARCVLDSLAHHFAAAAHQAAELSGTPLTQINIVGGGSQNALLCQGIADRAGVPVFAGPVEATALGSILVQARAMGVLEGSLDDLRELVRRTHVPLRYDQR